MCRRSRTTSIWNCSLTSCWRSGWARSWRRCREGTLEEISLRYSGHIAESKTDLIRNAAVKGILNEALEEKANLVNAEAIASSRGLRIHESRKPHSFGRRLGQRALGTAQDVDGRASGKGRGAARRAPRLLHVDGIDVEAPLERDLIYMRNRDVPGVIGRWGRFWASTRSISRTSPWDGGWETSNAPREAIAVVHVDGRVSDEVLKRLRGIPAVQTAKVVRLF